MADTAPASGTENRVVSFVLSKMLSNHGKRVMFVTSLYSRVVRFESLKAEAIEKLNDVMQLASNPNALELPTMAKNFIWKDRDIQTLLNETTLRNNIPEAEAQVISESVVDLAPHWLQYPRDKMIDDVMSLIRLGCDLPTSNVAHA